jgi:mannose-6-phosphate isomerase-like protein (cupin superfamily)
MRENIILKRYSSMKHRPFVNCHCGKGSINWIKILDRDDSKSGKIRFIHNDILPSGTSVGVHKHDSDEEYYYVLSSKGVMTLDGEKFEEFENNSKIIRLIFQIHIL